MDIYDIDGIINEALRSGIDISPADRREWAMFCCALKVLGYDETTFVALSSGVERDSRRTWRAERSPHRYKTEDTAKGMIVELAKSAGMEVKQFLLSPYNSDRPRADRRPTDPKLTSTPPPATAPTPKPEAVYITPQQVSAAQTHATETSLYKYLCQEYDRAEVEKVLSAYRFGGSKFADWIAGGRAASFPYIDRAGRCVDCHLMKYDPTTGSSKRADGSRLPNSWAIAELTEAECKRCKPTETRQQHKDCPNRDTCPRIPRRADWCNFGDHQLAGRPGDPIGIVESEKSAVILSMTYPETIWIAVGSKQNLTPERFEAYRGRKVTIYPDRDGYNDKPRKDGRGVEKGWRTIASELARHGFSLYIDTTTEKHYPQFVGIDDHGNPIECKKDIADLVLDFRHGEQPPTPTPAKDIPGTYTPDQPTEAQQVFDDLCKRNPALAKLNEVCQFEVIEVKPFEADNL